MGQGDKVHGREARLIAIVRGVSTLEEVRTEIDRLDREIVPLLGARLDFARQAARFKTNDVDVRAPARVERVIANVRELALEHGGNAAAVERIYRTIVAAMIDSELDHLAEVSRRS